MSAIRIESQICMFTVDMPRDFGRKNAQSSLKIYVRVDVCNITARRRDPRRRRCAAARGESGAQRANDAKVSAALALPAGWRAAAVAAAAHV